jgi:hypothetical protein
MPYNRADFITTSPLTNVALDRFFDEKDLVFPQANTLVPFDKATGKIYQTDGLGKLSLISDERGTDSEPDLDDEQLFGRTITPAEYKAGGEVNPRDVRDADVPGLLDEGRVVMRKTAQMMLAAEKRFADGVLTSSNYPSTLTSALTSGDKWSDAAGNPEEDKLVTIDEALLDWCGKPANAMIIASDVLAKLKLSPEFRSRTQYTQSAGLSDEQIKAYFKVDHLFVGKARYNSALPGAARSITKIWAGNDVVFFHFDPRMPTAADPGQNAFLMPFVGSLWWTDVYVDNKRKGSAGAMKRITVGAEYTFTPGFVESSSSSDYAAAYLLRDVVD